MRHFLFGSSQHPYSPSCKSLRKVRKAAASKCTGDAKEVTVVCPLVPLIIGVPKLIQISLYMLGLINRG